MRMLRNVLLVVLGCAVLVACVLVTYYVIRQEQARTRARDEQIAQAWAHYAEVAAQGELDVDRARADVKRGWLTERGFHKIYPDEGLSRAEPMLDRAHRKMVEAARQDVKNGGVTPGEFSRLLPGEELHP